MLPDGAYITSMGSAMCEARNGENTMTQYKVTATFKGYIAAIIFNRADSAADAVRQAKLHIVARFDKIRAEPVSATED
jgi:hypothetical protein